ncbi:hypothetical protein CW751_09025 [Brumimicrobium salinarum]|uniref:Uncharacterized protein n=1 Tax=Brumimicrobium salinarum TaxID=2058658 RepID=A0A2I0R1P6_9FLAO|nr:hypothetical protein [Brumimicrobium salinarum]PKR80508.1 hypothetical protein CW751_09025 [Brumimicrobium salinarum]
MKLFRRKKKYKGDADKKPAAKLSVKPLEYHPKILLAWAKGIEGNQELLNYLLENGYKELVMATHAIRLKDKARDWLMENGYPHLMAMINAAEGNKQALSWLRKNNFHLLYNMARAIDGDAEGFKWINTNSTQEWFYLTKVIKEVKDEIEMGHNDIHKRSTD